MAYKTIFSSGAKNLQHESKWNKALETWEKIDNDKFRLNDSLEEVLICGEEQDVRNALTTIVEAAKILADYPDDHTYYAFGCNGREFVMNRKRYIIRVSHIGDRILEGQAKHLIACSTSKKYLLREHSQYIPDRRRSAWSQIGNVRNYVREPQDFESAILDAFGISFEPKMKRSS